jgi:hypothetical protein
MARFPLPGVRDSSAVHRRMLGIDGLVSQLADVPRARDALRVLVDDGLATRLGDRVGRSRAAVRFDALAPIQGPPAHEAAQAGFSGAPHG